MAEIIWRNAKYPTFYIKDKPVSTNIMGLTHNLLGIANDLTNVKDESTDIFTKPDYAFYQRRPSSLEDLCFADFLSLYTPSTNQQNALFIVECIAAGKIIQRCYRRFDGDRTIKFLSPQWGATPNTNYYMFIFFFPWREIDELQPWGKCTSCMKQTIEKNFLRHKCFQTRYNEEDPTTDDNRIQTSDDSDSDVESLAVNLHTTMQEEVLNATLKLDRRSFSPFFKRLLPIPGAAPIIVNFGL